MNEYEVMHAFGLSKINQPQSSREQNGANSADSSAYARLVSQQAHLEEEMKHYGLEDILPEI